MLFRSASLPKDLALVHFDATVNQGSAAKRFLEESGGDVNKYLDLRRQHYIYLAESNPEKFGSSLKGWMNRLSKVEKDINSMERPTFKEYTGEILPLDAEVKKKKSIGELTEEIVTGPARAMVGAVESIANTAKKKPQSVLEGTTTPESVTPSMPDPLVRSIYDAATPDERILYAQEDPRFKQVDEYYKRIDAEKAQGEQFARFGYQPKTADVFDTRYESRVQKLVNQGVARETAEGMARYAMSEGISDAGRLVGEVKEQPPEAAITEEYRIKRDAPGYEQTGQVLKRGATKGALGVIQSGGGTVRFLQDLAGVDTSETENTLDELNKITKAIGEPTSKPVAYLEGAINSITQQAVPLVAGAITGSEALVLSSMFANSFGQTYDETRREGFDMAGATTRATAFAAFEVIGEKFGLGDQLAGIRAAARGVPTKDLSTYFAKALAKEIPGEELTYAGQFAVDKGFGMNPEAGIKEFIDGAIDTMGTTVAQGVIMMGGAGATSAVTRRMRGKQPEPTAQQFREEIGRAHV